MWRENQFSLKKRFPWKMTFRENYFSSNQTLPKLSLNSDIDGGPSKGTSYGPRKSNGMARIQDFAAKGTHSQGPQATHYRTVVHQGVQQVRIKPLFLPHF